MASVNIDLKCRFPSDSRFDRCFACVALNILVSPPVPVGGAKSKLL